MYDKRVEAGMTTKEALHHLVDELPEDQTELARMLLEDLRDADDVDGPPLDAVTLASLDRGLADIAAGRVKPLDEFKRERGL
jgi:predicted transcriptional regulator